jgi:hypothetical protein
MKNRRSEVFCSLVTGYEYSDEPSASIFSRERGDFYLHERGCRFLGNVGNQLLNYAVPYGKNHNINYEDQY